MANMKQKLVQARKLDSVKSGVQAHPSANQHSSSPSRSVAPTTTTRADVQTAANDFITELSFLADPNNNVFWEKFLLPLKLSVSSNDKFYVATNRWAEASSKGAKYSLPEEIDKLRKIGFALVGNVTNDEVAKNLIFEYLLSPFGLFLSIFRLPVSDIFVLKDKVAFSTTNTESSMTEIRIPNALIPKYRELAVNLREMVMASANLDTTQFNRSNAIIDCEYDNIRFNIVHGSLNADGSEFPIFSLRKDVTSGGTSIATDDKYLRDACSGNEGWMRAIKKLAYNGSYIVFGETGSGKTTLMRYMGGYRLSEKRNLLTIEDTPELHLPINIAFLTNGKYKIKDLFKISLRENPSHLLVGETRTDEIMNILESSLVFKVGTTLHADSFEKVIMRIIFLIRGAGNNFDSNDIGSLISSGIDGFIYMKDRKVQEVRMKKSLKDIKSMNDPVHNYDIVPEDPVDEAQMIRY